MDLYAQLGALDVACLIGGTLKPTRSIAAVRPTLLLDVGLVQGIFGRASPNSAVLSRSKSFEQVSSDQCLSWELNTYAPCSDFRDLYNMAFVMSSKQDDRDRVVNG